MYYEKSCKGCEGCESCIRILLADDNVVSNKVLKSFLVNLKKDDNAYKAFDRQVRKIKGNTSPFFILQKAYSLINA